MKVMSTSIWRFDALATVPSFGPTTLHSTPTCSSASRIGLSEAESTPSATRIATLRVRTTPSALPSLMRSAGDSSMGSSMRCSRKPEYPAAAFASGSPMPSGSATRRASFSSTCARLSTMRWRMAGTSSFESSKRKAATMCSFSAMLWLLKNRRACVKWSSNDGLRRRTFGDSISSGNDWKPWLPPSTRNSVPLPSVLGS
ncbi:hypothetical protein D3C72_1232050 [compost metagenome]